MASKLGAITANAADEATENVQKEKSLFSPVNGDPAQGSLFDAPAMSPANAGKSIELTAHSYSAISDINDVIALAKTLSELKEFCFDTETTSLDSLNTQLVSISFSWKSSEGIMIYFPADQNITRKFLDILKPIFQNPSIRKVGQNLKFDIQVLGCYGISVEGNLFDTMIAHYLLEPDMRHNMDLLASKYLGYTPVPIEDLIGERGPRQKNMRDVPLEKLTEYSVEDADITWQLKEVFEPMLVKEGLSELATGNRDAFD